MRIGRGALDVKGYRLGQGVQISLGAEATSTFDTSNSKDPTPSARYANQAEQPSSQPKNPLEQPSIQHTVLVRPLLTPICWDLRQNKCLFIVYIHLFIPKI